MKLTGERPMQGATPDSLLAFHDAGYREVRRAARPGHHGRRRLRGRRRDAAPRRPGPARRSAPTTARRRCSCAAVEHAPTTGCASARSTAPRWRSATRSVDNIVSSHIIEHFTNPVTHVAELARALRPDGTAFVITPNAPADFENPFHVYLVRARAARVAAVAVLRRGRRASASRATTRCTPTSRARREQRRAAAAPRRVAAAQAHAARAPTCGRTSACSRSCTGCSGSDRTGIGSGLSEADFFTTEHIDDRTPGLFAIARRPAGQGERARERRPARVWVTVPTYEEAENIELLVRRVREAVPDAHILVVDDNSSDGTAEKAEALGAELGGIEVLRRPQQDGARQRVPRRARRRHRPRLRRHDPDRRRPLARSRPISRGCSPRSTGAPISRSGPATRPAGACRTGRGTGSRCRSSGNRYAAFCLGIDVRDTTAGYRAYRASILQRDRLRHHALDGLRLPDRDDVPRASNAGGKIEEVPIAFTDRVRGNSKMSWRIVVEAMLLVTWWGLRDRVLRRNRCTR